MIAFKGFNKDLQCTLGKGIYQYKPGATVKEDRSKTADSGFHCAEYVLDCLAWYPLDGKNRYFKVEAAGSVDETDGDSKIACTEMTLLEELSAVGIAGEAIIYMARHPKREWEHSSRNVAVKRDRAECESGFGIAVARGRKPLVRGKEGAVIGLVKEDSRGNVRAAALHVAGKDGIKADTWYTIEGRMVKEVREDEA